MRIWAKLLKDNRIIQETVREYSSARPSDMKGWSVLLHDLCQDMDLCRPVLLNKHINDLIQFSRVVFKPADFIEPVDFDGLEIEIITEKKKNVSHSFI